MKSLYLNAFLRKAGDFMNLNGDKEADNNVCSSPEGAWKAGRWEDKEREVS